MAPLSGLALYFCIRMFAKLIPQYRAARSSWRPNGESREDKDVLLYSTNQELISAGFMVGKVILLLALFFLVFAPWWDPLPSSLWRGVVVRIGLDLIIILMLLHAITRSRYWDQMWQMIPVKALAHDHLENGEWDHVVDRRQSGE